MDDNIKLEWACRQIEELYRRLNDLEREKVNNALWASATPESRRSGKLIVPAADVVPGP